MAGFEAINRQKACRHGQMIYNVHDLVVGRSLDLYGEYCEGEIDLFRQVVTPGSVVVEVGANIGAHTRDGNFGSVAMDSQSTGERVPLCRLDDLRVPACQLLKVDVEGMEQQVLEGAVQLIDRFKPVIYLENDKPDKIGPLARYLDSLSYKMYWHESSYFNPRNFFGNQENVFPNVVSMNMVCIHESVPHELSPLEPVSVSPPGPSAS